jgi:hypothetical protein
MCQNATFYYTFCACEQGFTVWDTGDPAQHTHPIKNEPGKYPAHDCEDGKCYPLQRFDARASENRACPISEGADTQSSERPCFGHFAKKLELWVSMLRCDKLDIDRIGGKYMQITYQDPAQTFTPFFEHITRRRSPPNGADERREREEIGKNEERAETEDESGTVVIHRPKESFPEGVAKPKAPRTAEEKATRLERLRKRTVLANQQATNLTRKDSSERDRRDSAVSDNEQPDLQEGYEQEGIALKSAAPSITTKVQFPEPFLSNPPTQPPIRLSGMNKSTSPQRFVPPKGYSYTSLRFPPGHREEWAIATEVRELSEEEQPPRDQRMPSMTGYHTIAGDMRYDIAKFTLNQQSAVPPFLYATQCSQQMPEKSKYYTINGVRPDTAPFTPSQHPKARPTSTQDTQQQLQLNRHPSDSNCLRPEAPNFKPVQQQAERVEQENTISETISQNSPPTSGKSTRRRLRRKWIYKVSPGGE